MDDMPQDIPKEKLLTLGRAARTLATKPGAMTVWRWARQGLKVRHNVERIKLRAIYDGGIMFTTADWLEEFTAAVKRAREGDRHPTVKRVRPTRLPSHELAHKELQEVGA